MDIKHRKNEVHGRHRQKMIGGFWGNFKSLLLSSHSVTLSPESGTGDLSNPVAVLNGPISRDMIICSNTLCRKVEMLEPSPTLLATAVSPDGADLLPAPLANIMLFSLLNTGTIASSSEMIARIDKWDCKRYKNSAQQKKYLTAWRASLHSKVFTSYLFDKGLVSRLYKKLKRWQNPSESSNQVINWKINGQTIIIKSTNR